MSIAMSNIWLYEGNIPKIWWHCNSNNFTFFLHFISFQLLFAESHAWHKFRINISKRKSYRCISISKSLHSPDWTRWTIVPTHIPLDLAASLVGCWWVFILIVRSAPAWPPQPWLLSPHRPRPRWCRHVGVVWWCLGWRLQFNILSSDLLTLSILEF